MVGFRVMADCLVVVLSNLVFARVLATAGCSLFSCLMFGLGFLGVLRLIGPLLGLFVLFGMPILGLGH